MKLCTRAKMEVQSMKTEREFRKYVQMMKLPALGFPSLGKSSALPSVNFR